MLASVFALAVLLFCSPSLAHLHQDDQTGHIKRESGAPSRLHHYEPLASTIHVTPIFHTAERSIQKRDSLEQPYPDTLALRLDAYNTTFVFDLEINEDLFHPNVKVKVYSEEGIRYLKPTHRYYKGTVTSAFGSGNARLTLHGTPTEMSLQGTFFQDDEVFEVKPTDQFMTMKAEVHHSPSNRKRMDQGNVDMVLFKHSDLEVLDPEAEKCGVDHSQFSQHADTGLFQTSQSAHDDFTFEKRAQTGCPTSKKVLYMGFAADCAYAAQFGDAEAAKDKILTNVNSVSALYDSTFNIAIGVIEIQIKTACGSTPPDENGGTLAWNAGCTSAYTISNRLSDFSNWRGSQSTDAGLWHLMSTCNTGSTIGIAWLNMLCQTAAFDQQGSSGTEYVSGVGVTTTVDNEWVVLAHEIGHNFGAKHDCTSSCSGSGDTSCCTCSPSCDCGAQFIMHPSNSISTNTFSSCSQTTMCSRSSITGTCLAEPGSRSVLNKNQCGNGIWEPPEQCDCGGADTCANQTCCFPGNCTLVPGAVCSDYNTACCQNCQIVNTANSIVCRPVENECDVEEKCDGVNALCPTNTFKEDGTVCTEIPDGYCATGRCTNRQQQCITTGILYDKPEFTTDCLDSCRLFCESTFGDCRYFPGNFLNGTKCGKDGVCQGGICSTGDFIGKVIAFFQKYLILVIVAACVLGLLILGFLFWGCRKANRKDLKLGRSLANLRSGMTLRRNKAAPPSRAAQGNRGAARGGQNQGPPSPRSSQEARPQGGRASGGRAMSHSSDRTTQMEIPAAPPSYSDVPLQVRCPICSKMFPSESALGGHLDHDH